MKPLILFFSLGTLLYGEAHFTLPDAAYDAVHHLVKAIKKSHAHIFLMTPHLDHYELKNALKQAARAGIGITLVTPGNDVSEQLALYTNIDVRRNLKPVTTTLMAIDASYCCTFKGALSSAVLETERGVLTCKACDETALTLLRQQSRPYLED